MAFTAGVKTANHTGPGSHGLGLIVRAATVTTVPQTVLFAPYKLTDRTNVLVLRDAGPNDTAGAITVVSLASTGKSITFTPAATGQIGLVIVGDVEMQDRGNPS